MIISASRRTDIPTFYSEWMMHRLREGYVMTVNPFNRAQVKRVSLAPADVDCIVFWTKDAAPIFPYLDELDSMGYDYIFQFTVTPYGNDIERNLRAKSLIEDDFLRLSERIGSERVLWRYDPIIVNDRLAVEYHMEQFDRMCTKFHGASENVTISFVDMYPKLNKFSGVLRPVTDDEMRKLCMHMSKTAVSHGMRITACCEERDFTAYGVERGSCIDKNIIERVIGRPLDVKRDRNQRVGCGCYQSVDIGAYNTCGNGCIYCYACKSVSRVRHNIADSPHL